MVHSIRSSHFLLAQGSIHCTPFCLWRSPFGEMSADPETGQQDHMPLAVHSKIPHSKKSFPTMRTGLPFCFKSQFMGGSHNFVKSYISLCFCAFSGAWLLQSREQHQPTAVYLRNTGAMHWAQFSRWQCLLLLTLPCHVSTNIRSNILMLYYIQIPMFSYIQPRLEGAREILFCASEFG